MLIQTRISSSSPEPILWTQCWSEYLSYVLLTPAASVSLSLPVCPSVCLSLTSSLSSRSDNFEVSKRRLTVVSMPVSGPPVAVKGDLTDPPQEQGLTSWKVVGDTTATVAVLRFSPADPAAITTWQPGLSQVTFRRKPPSQVRRYCKGAEERQKARARLLSAFIYVNTTCHTN